MGQPPLAVSGQCDVEVVDIYQHPALARDDQIIPALTLVKTRPNMCDGAEHVGH